MRTLPALCLTLTLVPGLAGAVSAQDDVRGVVEKAIKALGGEERLARRPAVHSRVKGSFVGLPAGAAAGIGVSGESWSQAGAHRMSLVIELGGQKATMTRAVLGGKGWEESDGAVENMDADDLAEAKLSEYVDRLLSLLPLLKDRDLTVKGLGKLKVDGVELFGVKVSSAGRPDVTLYFDPETGYPRRVEYREKSKALGKEVATATVFDDYRDVEPGAAEERVLREAKVGTDGPALLEFLRRQVRSPADREKVGGLVKQLGDDSFEVRETATQELIRLGAVALPELRRAAKDADAELAARARRCLGKITAVKGPEAVLLEALRLVAARRPPGAAEALLALAPTLTDETDARELRNALAAVAVRDGKADRAVEKALEDADPSRRAAAAAALGKDGGAFEKQPGRRLFLPGARRAMKTIYYQDGERQLVLQVVDVELYNRFDDALFVKPK